ncbi:uncharacterized protein LOC126911090 [Spodoptera frugiperda]|uniref:Uncharacterized protein LOC126911090 n=1 Tax=Spodoptera frugiperda TaxID=7108 RepID=A0A9R0DSG7_SPOFR|nr:uncharacterized protein LOC126911090 [Spodoptera frugiperda]
MFHTVDTFTRCLFYFTMALQKLRMLDNVEDDKRDLQQSVTVVLAVVWLSKNIFVLVMHSVLGEKFYITIEEAETACIQRLKNRNYFEYEGVLCKEVVQLNRVSFSKLDAFGLFHIDGTLPLHFAGIVTNYIVLILQTMFL